MIRTLSIVFATLFATAAAPAAAQFDWDLTLGAAYVSDSEYDSSPFSNTSLGYNLTDWSLRAGYMRLGKFELSSARSEARITMRGPYVQALRRFDTRVVSWELGLGVARLESEAELSRRILETQSDWDAFVELAVLKSVSDTLSFKASVIYFNDRLGTDVSAFSAGVRYSF